MNKVRFGVCVTILNLCFMLGGCKDATNLNEITETPSELQTEYTEEKQETENKELDLQLESDEKEESLAQNAENEAKANLDNWIGKYTFDEVISEEGNAPMFMDYDIDIYKESDQYYANVEINGQLTGINLKAKIYGNEEWISLVIAEYNPEHVTGLSNAENSVLLSLRRQGEDIYTYWGVMEPLYEKNLVSGKYLEKETEQEVIQTDNAGEMDGLENWVGRYIFSEKLGKEAENQRKYDIKIYEEDEQYYADLRIKGQDTGIDVKTQIYGNEEWISLVLMEYNPGHEAGLEDMKNSVLLSLRQEGEDIYTYWGGRNVTEALKDDYLTYYDSNSFFKKGNNPYFYTNDDVNLTATFTYRDLEEQIVRDGTLNIKLVKNYENGDLFKLSVDDKEKIQECLSEDRLNVYFYVTEDEIYRLWPYIYQDEEVIRFYNDDDLIVKYLDTDDKLIANGELVCCKESVPDKLDWPESGSHVDIIQQNDQVEYDRVDLNANGDRQFYERFIWEKGKGLVEFRSGFRVEADILYIENITKQ